MKLIIRYAKQNGRGKVRLIDGCFYTVELRSNNKKMITDVISSIYEDCSHGYLEWFMERMADVFCCYLLDEGEEDIKPENYVFKSDSIRRKEPIAILDGLVRRMKVDKISMTNGKFIQTFEGLKVADRDKEDIIAKKYTYESVRPDKTVTTGKNVRFMFPYRDSKNAPQGFSYNDQLANNCIPFCFILEGEFTSVYRDNENFFLDYVETTVYRLCLKKQKVEREDDVIWFLNGKIYKKVTNNLDENPEDEQDDSKAVNLNEDLDKDETEISGLFYSGLLAEEYEVFRMNPWFADVQEATGSRVIHSKLDEMIVWDKYVTTEPFVEFRKDIHRHIVRKLKSYGLKLFEKPQNVRRKPDGLIMLNGKQTKAILGKFELTTGDPSSVVSDMDAAAQKYLKDGKICKADVGAFVEDLVRVFKPENEVPDKTDEDRPGKYLFENYRIAVHEVGHAIVQRQLFGGYTIKKVSIVPAANCGGYVGTDMEHANINENLPTLENYICVALASKIAEEMCFGAADRGWSQDMQSALGYLIRIIRECAAIDTVNYDICCFLNRTDAILADDALDVLMDRYMERTRKLLEDKKDMILELAGNMMLEQDVNGVRFNEMCEFYEEKQNVKKDRELCERLHLTIETALQYNRNNKKSKEFINLFTTPGEEIIFHKLFKYHPEIDPKCGAVSMINAMLGYNLFSKDGLKPISSKLSGYGGAIGMVIDKDGKNFAVFIDGTDRTGRGEGVRLIHGKKRGKFVKYDTIDTATKMIYAGENGSSSVKNV